MIAITFLNNWCAGVKSGLLQDANLLGADLRGADLRGANLQDAYLQGADLQDAYLRGANLRGANLRGADLQDADLQGADLQKCVGNGKEIKHTARYRWHIVWTADVLQIGCQRHPIKEWRDFTDETIRAMAQGALEFWHVHKASIMEMIK
jgi:uncharacterized protein YjbI with pentapeptide repeats